MDARGLDDDGTIAREGALHRVTATSPPSSTPHAPTSPAQYTAVHGEKTPRP